MRSDHLSEAWVAPRPTATLSCWHFDAMPELKTAFEGKGQD
jgi:hypothetical protein